MEGKLRRGGGEDGRCYSDLKTRVAPSTRRPSQSQARSKEQYRTRLAEGSGKTLETAFLFFTGTTMCGQPFWMTSGKAVTEIDRRLGEASAFAQVNSKMPLMSS